MESSDAAGGGPPPRLACPRCGRRMALGLAHVSATPARFLAVGLSWQSLWFDADGGGAPLEVLAGGRDAGAQHCGGCGTLVLFTRP